MSGHALDLSGTVSERAVHHVGRLDRHVEELTLARHLPVGDAGLDHVAHVVELVAGARVAPALRPHHPRTGKALHLLHAERARGVEVAVGLLRARDVGDELVEVLLKLRVRVGGERVGRALDDLEDVGVVERATLERALGALRRLAEVGEAPRLLALVEVGLHGDDAVRLEARQPEAGRDRDVRHVRLLHRIVGRGGNDGTGAFRRTVEPVREGGHGLPTVEEGLVGVVAHDLLSVRVTGAEHVRRDLGVVVEELELQMLERLPEVVHPLDRAEVLVVGVVERRAAVQLEHLERTALGRVEVGGHGLAAAHGVRLAAARAARAWRVDGGVEGLAHDDAGVDHVPDRQVAVHQFALLAVPAGEGAHVERVVEHGGTVVDAAF